MSELEKLNEMSNKIKEETQNLVDLHRKEDKYFYNYTIYINKKILVHRSTCSGNDHAIRIEDISWIHKGDNDSDMFDSYNVDYDNKLYLVMRGSNYAVLSYSTR